MLTPDRRCGQHGRGRASSVSHSSPMNGRPEATVAARGAVAAAGAALVVGTLVVADGPARFTTYAGRSSAAAALTVCVVVSLTAAGVCGAGARRGAVISVPPILAAVAWVAPVWVGWHGGSAFLRSVALAATGFVVALVVHTAARVLAGRSTTRAARALIAAAYAEAL